MPCLALADLLGLPSTVRDEDRTLIVLRLAAGELFALTVDGLHDHEELVVKPVAPAVMATGIYAGTTLTDEGVDLVFSNWRGIVAAPGISEEETQRFVDAITEMHGSDAWQQVLEDQGWTDAFITGEEFSDFLDEESNRVQGVLSELGLA